MKWNKKTLNNGIHAIIWLNIQFEISNLKKRQKLVPVHRWFELLYLDIVDLSWSSNSFVWITDNYLSTIGLI